MIRTIIVDDEILSRIGIRSFIDGKEDIKVTGVFGGAAEALEFLRENVTDMVITDIEMAEMSGLDLISAIRAENLAPGIIILSCHDNFAYAQEAISKGTNSYLLKMDITEDVLIKEIKKVYSQTAADDHPVRKPDTHQEGSMETGTYVIVIPRVKTAASEEGMESLDNSMLVSMLEEVICRYQMGTLFSPYNREMFIMFLFDRKLSENDISTELSKNLSVISSNVKQYINGEIIFGVSAPFADQREAREHYDEAAAAADLDFYDLKKDVYMWQENQAEPPKITFTADRFAEAEGIGRFSVELHEICESARKEKAAVNVFKNRLIQGINDMTYQLFHENRLSEEFSGRWNISSRTIALVTEAGSLTHMEEKLAGLYREFHADMVSELTMDEFSRIFRYIEQNLGQKISLMELAEIGCMSIPTLSKKFKERTDLTVTQYMNRERIRRAQILLKNPANSLWQIAEITGFANVNYLIRVFKKVTGTTIGEYRKQLGINGTEEDEKSSDFE